MKFELYIERAELDMYFADSVVVFYVRKNNFVKKSNIGVEKI